MMDRLRDAANRGKSLDLGLSGASRSVRRSVMFVFDAVVIALALPMSLALKYGTLDLPQPQRLFLACLILPAVGVIIFRALGIYRSMLRSLESYAVLFLALGALLLSLALLVTAALQPSWNIPFTAVLTFGLLVFVATLGWRAAAKLYYRTMIAPTGTREGVIIYGAGTRGARLAAYIQNQNDRHVVAFVEDDPDLVGTTIRGVRVHPSSQVHEIAERIGVKTVILAFDTKLNDERRDIVLSFAKGNLRTLLAPTAKELLDGAARTQDLSQMRPEDLLGRPRVPPVDALYVEAVAGRTFLVTGAAGSIGKEIVRNLIALAPARVIAFDSSEFGLHALQQELAQTDHEAAIVQVLGSVLDRTLVRQTLERHGVDVVYHAAAYKHVPIVEDNARVGLVNNALGTATVAQEAAHAGCSHFVLVSTDKAVRPPNVMGASKRLSELLVQDLHGRGGKTVFTGVRFGNVLGSSGSVVPHFQKQIAAGGPITVTHREITRFFMTISEAAELVIQAGFLAKGGDILLLDMGEPVEVNELAELMVRMSGKTVKSDSNPAGDIEVVYSGLRPGEKLYEELLIDSDAQETLHPKILRGVETSIDPEEVSAAYDWLVELARGDEGANLKARLKRYVVEYAPEETNDA
ncbi:polysaccharide biosynthesis protein [Rhizobiaceae bacterium]|nr:polysaccharide biosynthesis protein [Rhizobiaceae bacterium]